MGGLISSSSSTTFASANVVDTILILGPEKTGKSSLINALVFGEPMTSIPTRGRYEMPYQTHTLLEYGGANIKHWQTFYESQKPKNPIKALFFIIDACVNDEEYYHAQRDTLLHVFTWLKPPDLSLFLIFNQSSSSSSSHPTGVTRKRKQEIMQLKQLSQSHLYVASIELNCYNPNPDTLDALFLAVENIDE